MKKITDPQIVTEPVETEEVTTTIITLTDEELERIRVENPVLHLALTTYGEPGERVKRPVRPVRHRSE